MDIYNKPSPQEFLAHHGVKGQKWGVRNGPPYPLDAEDHSASEKKAGWQKSLDKGDGKGDNKRKVRTIPLTAEQKSGGGPGKETVAKTGKRDKLNQEVLKRAIESGEVSLKINLGHQKKHLPSREDKRRSYILGTLADAQRLVSELSGTGEQLLNTKTGEWLKKERVTASDKIGVYFDGDTGEEILTEKLMIIYSRKGTHIYAAQP